MEQYRPKSALILGAGYIGMEMADALTRKGLFVTLLVRSGRILKTLDPEMGAMVRKELERRGIKIIYRLAVKSIDRKDEKLVIRNYQKIPVEGDMVLAATGGRPETGIAVTAGISTGIQNAT